MVKIDITVNTNQYFKNLIDQNFMDKGLFLRPHTRSVETLHNIVKQELFTRKRPNSPRVRSGQLVRNIEWGVGRTGTGSYLGEVGVLGGKVPYARLLELGGVTRKKGSKSKTAFPARYYLRNPLLEYALDIYSKYVVIFFKSLKDI